MKAMILAAGEGTRLQPLTYHFPKPLVPIVNKPVMEHIVSWLLSNQIREIVINTHYLADQIEGYFKDGSQLGVQIRYSREEQLWGTAGGVRNAKDHFKETFLVIGGDDLSDVDLSKLVKLHHDRNAVATIGLKKVRQTQQYGVVVVNENGRIERFQEKPKQDEALSNLANTGIYLFEPEIFEYIPEDEIFDFGRQVFPLLLEEKAEFYGASVQGYWQDVGSLAEYKESHWDILDGNCKVEIPGKLISDGVRAEEDVSVHPKAVIHPPCILGKGTKIGEGAMLSGHVVTGRNVVVGKNARLEKVILWDGVMVEKNSMLRDRVVNVNAVP